jgi:hypothetical protein
MHLNTGSRSLALWPPRARVRQIDNSKAHRRWGNRDDVFPVAPIRLTMLAIWVEYKQNRCTFLKRQLKTFTAGIDAHQRRKRYPYRDV